MPLEKVKKSSEGLRAAKIGAKAAKMSRVKVEDGKAAGKGRRRVRSPSPELVCLSDVSNAANVVAGVRVKQEPRKGGVPNKRQKGDDGERASAAPLLEQLRYGQVLKKIAEIRKLTKAGMKKIGEEMVLPRIIVIGNESSGKSSTLERIAGQPVLPCDTGICTRAPVVLELRYDPTVVDAEIYFRGFSDGGGPVTRKGAAGEYERVKDAEHARTKVQAAMDSLKNVGVASDKEVRVKIVSQDVPTLDLVDLPGIVLARNNKQGSGNEPHNITQQTVDCTTRFLSSLDTAVVLCIVAAAEPNLRTVKALGLLQESSQYEKLKNSTIGVFAQTDKLFDATYEDEGREGPRWKLEARLRGTADDQVHLVHGFVAVKNRNSRSKTKTEDLSGCWSTESAWFAKESAFRQGEKENKAVAAELSDRLGLCALLQKIDTVFCKHLNEHWVPKEVAAVDKELEELNVRYAEVSTCISRLEGKDCTKFVEHIRSRIASVLSDSQLERWCQEYVRAQLQKANGQWDKNSLVAYLRGVHKAMADLAENFKDAYTHFSLLFESELAVEFNKASWGGVGDQEKFIDLRPYHHVLGDVLQALRGFLAKKSTESAKAIEAGKEAIADQLMFHRADYLHESVSCTSLEALVRVILLRNLLLPCVQGVGDREPTMPWLPCPAACAAGVSVFKQEKKMLEEQMQTCNEVKKSLRALC